jgi:ribosomal-protein-alanine N-acetyltransferase
MSMLVGSLVALRPVRSADLDLLWNAHIDIANRGDFFPRGVQSESAFRRSHAETGMWEAEEGTLLITVDDAVVGHIEFFRPVSYWDAYELSYQLYDQAHAGAGYVTEAVQLLVDYLFATKQRGRVQLVIVPGNAASRRIAEKCGFSLEGTCRGAFFNHGQSNDVLMYSLLRDDPRPWRVDPE